MGGCLYNNHKLKTAPSADDADDSSNKTWVTVYYWVLNTVSRDVQIAVINTSF